MDGCENMLNCHECNKRFSLKHNLIRHNMNTHSGEKLFACDKCSHTFALKDNLIRHMITHDGEKQFACDECSITFSLNENLVRHKRIYTGEKQFACAECNRAFSLKQNLARHMRSHKSFGGEKPFVCAKCSKAFSYKSNMVRHIRMHADEERVSRVKFYKAFSREVIPSLRHTFLESQTGEKLIACTECNRDSEKKADSKIHTGEKLSACPDCKIISSGNSDSTTDMDKMIWTKMETNTGEKPFASPECTTVFPENADSVTHVGDTPRATGEFSLAKCSPSFPRKVEPSRRLKTRSVEKRLSCPECHKAFAYESKLAAHNPHWREAVRLPCVSKSLPK